MLQIQKFPSMFCKVIIYVFISLFSQIYITTRVGVRERYLFIYKWKWSIGIWVMEDIFEKWKREKKSFRPHPHSIKNIGILWGRNKLSTSNDAIHISASANVQHATFDTTENFLWDGVGSSYCIRIFLTNIYCSIWPFQVQGKFNAIKWGSTSTLQLVLLSTSDTWILIWAERI